MNALVLNALNQALAYQTMDTPQASADEAVVALKAAALNHRDVWITKGQYPGIHFPAILGSDGAGTWEGQEWLINPNIGWGPSQKVQAKSYHILGLPTNGTYAEYVKVNQDRLVPKPGHLSWEEAAALPLAGLTAYRALFTRGKLQAGEKVLISGVGGGVALFAFQFALAVGASVYVTSGKKEKIEKALALGAKDGQLYTDEKWGRSFGKKTRGFDLIIDSAGGKGFANLVDAATPGGRIVFYGGTAGTIAVSPQKIFWKQLDVMGSTMGSDQDFRQMVQFVTKHQIHPIIDQVFALSQGNEALKKMEEGKQFGKIVLQIQK